MVVANGLKVGVIHGVFGRNSFGMVVSKHLAQKVQSFIRNKLVVLGVNEFSPRLAWDRLAGQKIFVMRVQGQSVFVQVCVQLFGSKHFGDLYKLVIVVTALEERLALENHSRKHAAERPDVERVVVSLEVDEQLRSFEVPGGNSHIVLLARVIELCQAPVNKTQLAVGVVDHDIVRFYVTMHNALRVAVVKGLQDFKHVVSNVKVVETLVKFSEISVTGIDELGDNGWRLR